MINSRFGLGFLAFLFGKPPLAGQRHLCATGWIGTGKQYAPTTRQLSWPGYHWAMWLWDKDSQIASLLLPVLMHRFPEWRETLLELYAQEAIHFSVQTILLQSTTLLCQFATRLLLNNNLKLHFFLLHRH